MWGQPPLPVARDKGCENAPEGKGHLRKSSTPETVQIIDRDNPHRDQERERTIEPGHYYGISR